MAASQSSTSSSFVGSSSVITQSHSHSHPHSHSLNHPSVVTPPSAQILTVAPVPVPSNASMSYLSSDATTAHLQWQQAIETFINEPIEANQIQLIVDSPATGACALSLSLSTALSGTSSNPLPVGALV